MGFWDYIGQGTGLNLLGRAKNYFFDQPAAQLKEGANKAAGEFRAAGGQAGATEMAGLNRGLGYFDQAQGALDRSLGQLEGPSSSEQLYADRRAGTDPYYNYMAQKGGQQLDNLFAAQGGFNSGRNAAAHADYLANLGAQQSQQMAGLAGQADRSRYGRLGDIFERSFGLGGARAGLTSGAYGQAAGFGFQGDTLGAGSRLYGSGIEAQKRANELGFLRDLAGGGAQFFGGR